MPNLNLIEEEGGGEGTMQPVSAPTRRQGGGGGSKVVIIFVVLLLLGGGVFALNKFGIIKLWGKKKPVVAQVQEDPFPADQYVDTTAAMQDTTSIAFVDTPPIDEGKKGTRTTATMETGMEGGKLAEMKGSYTIQVSAWRDQAMADTYVKRLEDAGYPAYIQKRALRDGDWYTVRIGRYPSMKDARKAVETFAMEIKTHYWIDKVRM